MELGKKIRQLRFKAGLTQEQLAERLGLVPQSISKWENAVAMPDIATLPLLAEIFGVSIDDLFDLSSEQRFNRIENRMDIEEELPQDVFREYEDFLRERLSSPAHRQRATELLAALYHHRMCSDAVQVCRYAKDAVRSAPGVKGSQWLLQLAEGHAAWDWNISNHVSAIEFYRELTRKHPGERLPWMYLLDNLIADRLTDEAERALGRLCALEGVNPVLTEVYRAHIALCRCDESQADGIIEALLAAHPQDSVCLFEAAQYYAKKGECARAIELYEWAFEQDPARPRFQDALQGIADLYRLLGDYRSAAATCERIIVLLKDEWGMTEEAELRRVQAEKARLLALADGGSE